MAFVQRAADKRSPSRLKRSQRRPRFVPPVHFPRFRPPGSVCICPTTEPTPIRVPTWREHHMLNSLQLRGTDWPRKPIYDNGEFPQTRAQRGPLDSRIYWKMNLHLFKQNIRRSKEAHLRRGGFCPSPGASRSLGSPEKSYACAACSCPPPVQQLRAGGQFVAVHIFPQRHQQLAGHRHDAHPPHALAVVGKTRAEPPA